MFVSISHRVSRAAAGSKLQHSCWPGLLLYGVSVFIVFSTFGSIAWLPKGDHQGPQSEGLYSQKIERTSPEKRQFGLKHVAIGTRPSALANG